MVRHKGVPLNGARFCAKILPEGVEILPQTLPRPCALGTGNIYLCARLSPIPKVARLQINNISNKRIRQLTSRIETLTADTDKCSLSCAYSFNKNEWINAKLTKSAKKHYVFFERYKSCRFQSLLFKYSSGFRSSLRISSSTLFEQMFI